MPRLLESRLAILEALHREYGPLPPPGAGPPPLKQDQTAFEAIVRAGLGLVTDLKIVSAAFEALANAGLLDPEALAGANPLEVDDIFQQAKVRLAAKALKPLQRIARWFERHDDQNLEQLSTEAIRDDWRALNGVGPASADALLLFGLARPTIPVDRSSYRILVRHGWLDPSSDYDEARSVLESIAPEDAQGLGQLALGLEKLGRDYCKVSAPKCDRCPLRPLLPEGGPVVGD